MSRCVWKRCVGIVAAVWVLLGWSPVASVGAETESAVSPKQLEHFENEIRPLLVNHCFQCHGGESTKGGLRVDSRAALIEGGARGPAIRPGKPGESLLVHAVRHADGLKMPLGADRLGDREIEALETWIAAGAAWPDEAAGSWEVPSERRSENHWSFRPIADPTPPDVAQTARVSTPIDRFILAKLESEGLTPLRRADKRTLIRRATFDLTGLPPTPAQIERFLRDDSPDAMAKLVDRLLNSPAYGERWGRHWLDLARYADTAGDTSDYPIPQAYRYRDYVIESFNEDKPYDQFLREQLAGDILAERDAAELSQKQFAERVIATGFLALARQFGPGPRNEPHLIIEDTINTLGETMLGLTIGCARCHDHKFDPIPNEDYYGLYGYFQSTVYPHAGSEESPRPGGLYPLTTDAELRREFFRYTERKVELGNNILQAARGRSYLEHSKAHYEKQLKELEANRPPVEQVAFAVREANPQIELAVGPVRSPKASNKTGDARVQVAGEPSQPGEIAPRGFVEVIDPRDATIPEGSSGRLQLANWIASPENPLTARVMVNRIWLYHFGKGLVGTPNNFGTQGQPPTHPELLDYLAQRFIQSGWSIKAMHRLIMNSQVYQLASTPLASERGEAGRAKRPAASGAEGGVAGAIMFEENLSQDTSNRWYWRFDRRRLDAEQVRDAILAVAGTLNTTPGGPHPFPESHAWSFTQHTPFHQTYESQHRSVYLMTQRLHRHPILKLFDAPDRSASTPQRRVSTVPLQALFLMNSGFVRDQARAFARRVIGRTESPAARVRFAHELAWGRPATEAQVAKARRVLASFRQTGADDADLSPAERERRAWTSYARVLISSNSFFYVD